MIEFRDISKSFDGAAAVRAVSLAISTHNITALIGPSGSGKSTLLRLVMGLISPDRGTLWIDGHELKLSSAAATRGRVGYVIQDGGLFPHLRARENLSLQAQVLGWTAERIADRIATLAELTHFPLDGLDRYPLQLSGGQRQRVALMRALMLDPDVLLLDEPLGALDPLIRADLQNDLRDIFRKLRKTVLMVTHDLAEAVYFADDIVLLHEGRVIQQGSFSDLATNPSSPFVTRFIRAQRTLHLTDTEGGK
ncbi:MAG: ATP-binding cassette domain-containing protein [Candidatus Latescibacterota bacterium]|nr:MAG: ATP-binding cassette domain-containing protein [Candidatus Latescibacterota bacterium]